MDKSKFGFCIAKSYWAVTLVGPIQLTLSDLFLWSDIVGDTWSMVKAFIFLIPDWYILKLFIYFIYMNTVKKVFLLCIDYESVQGYLKYKRVDKKQTNKEKLILA